MIFKEPKDKTTIKTLEEWKIKVFGTGQKAIHWKVGRSAYSLAKFMLEKDGVKYVTKLLEEALNEKIQLDEAIIEKEVRFDDYGHGREDDLGIIGNTASGKSIFIGLEAKVDEPFGESIGQVYLKSKSKELNGTSTNAPKQKH